MQELLSFIESNKKRYLAELTEIIRIPTVSTQPLHKPDMNRCAEHLVNGFKQIGMQKALAYETETNPIVYAEWLGAPGKPTVLFYGHYDVQPADKKDGWDTEPFEPTVKGDDLYARGSTDNKGQFFVHMKAVEVYLKKNGKLPINVKFMLEGEEEIGSVNTPKFVQANRQMLACDAVLLSDTPMVARNQPTIIYCLRGIVNLQVNLYGPKMDLHSGLFGGTVTNPVNALAIMIAKLKDESGKVTIPGFYDDVRAMTALEKEMVRKLPFNESDYRANIGVDELTGEAEFHPYERVSLRPTFEVCGIYGGYTEEGEKNIIPSKAHAKFNFRLAPNQDPQKIFKLIEKYLLQIKPAGVRMEIVFNNTAGDAYFTPLEAPALQAATTALKKAFNRDVLLQGSGGSIPILPVFLKELGAPSILMSLGMPGENMHGPNERLSLTHFYKGMEASIYFIDEMSKLAK